MARSRRVDAPSGCPLFGAPTRNNAWAPLPRFAGRLQLFNKDLKALLGVETDPRFHRLTALACRGCLGWRNIMVGSNLPRHIVERFERRWAQKLEAQARAWKSAGPDDRSFTDRGVPVVRRRKRSKPTKEVAA